ncbi:hypothetical protein QUB80_17955 [Chlorogloeopsis sp. ULAP01]|uniref:hypothetical protein n=1 Tax=Chlorogloeopsis sp. ULAP01 TaxID=3056483 RepID=UPI0025AAF65C|nr:hypothetical protein [Chlorogloeopsis sp. ULAP01]MDM9382585.1 hypothetical protein [Chlorogloeopsis sp. ULAP01]
MKQPTTKGGSRRRRKAVRGSQSWRFPSRLRTPEPVRRRRSRKGWGTAIRPWRSLRVPGGWTGFPA